MKLDFSVVLGFKDALLAGLLTTLQITSLSIVMGAILGFLVALARVSSNRLLFVASTTFVSVFRGTPVLIQLFWIFFCLPLIVGVDLSGFTSCVIALTLYMAAISSETFRSSLRFVSREQYDAGVALGLPYMVLVLNVILPQAVLRAVPTLISNCTSLFKESALVSAVGMADLMFVSQNIANRTGRPVEILTTAALVYFIIAFPIARAVTVVERRILDRLSI